MAALETSAADHRHDLAGVIVDRDHRALKLGRLFVRRGHRRRFWIELLDAHFDHIAAPHDVFGGLFLRPRKAFTIDRRVPFRDSRVNDAPFGAGDDCGKHVACGGLARPLRQFVGVDRPSFGQHVSGRLAETAPFVEAPQAGVQRAV